MSSISQVEVLKAARALVERGWAQGTFARTRTGRPVHVLDPDATCWCAIGAVGRAVGDLVPSGAELAQSHLRVKALYALQRVTTHQTASWNDNPERTIEEVLAAFDKAIALLEEPT